MTTPLITRLEEAADMQCPKCNARSGDDWEQCKGSCPMPGSPHFESQPQGQAMTDTVRVPRGAVEAIADDLRAISLELTKKRATTPVSEDIFRKALALEAMLAASPQGDGLSADANAALLLVSGVNVSDDEVLPDDITIGSQPQGQAMTDTVRDERDAFEAWFCDDAAKSGLDFWPTDIAAMRDGDEYGSQRVAINSKWEGWQARAMLAASPQGEGSSGKWIKHDGGPNPVPGEMVDVWIRGSLAASKNLDSDGLQWERTGGAFDIIAYRVTEGVKP